MRRTTQSLRATILILLAGFLLAGCGGPGEVRYVNRSNSTETLTLNRDRTVKTKLISTFHGVSIGSYAMKAANETTSGGFTRDSEGIKFRTEQGKAETVKFKADGSFEYANVTWEPAHVLKEKSLKAIATSSAAGSAH